VAEQEREVVVDPALLVVQVRMADAAGEDVHQRLARARYLWSRLSTRASPTGIEKMMVEPAVRLTAKAMIQAP
jgi:hypothetical protein